VVLFAILLAVADLPGLIPGSHLNRGLGIQFLKHAERCAALVYILDLAASEPWTHLELLQFELSQFSPELLKRPQLVVANKLDLPEAKVIHCACNTVKASSQSKIMSEDNLSVLFL
jgi:GTP-binding protein